MKEEIILQGFALSKGIGFGQPWIIVSEEMSYPFQSKKMDADEEVSRFRDALGLSRSDLHLLQKSLIKEGNPEVIEILEAHLTMLQDPFITKEVEEKIRSSTKGSAETVFLEAISDYKKRFSCKKNGFFQERIRDVVDISSRILGHLRPLKKANLQAIEKNSIVIAREFSPSIVAEINGKYVKGLLAERGGISSHSAIIARAKNIPYVVGIDYTVASKASSLIIDGYKGLVILNPSEKTQKDYLDELKRQKRRVSILQKNASLESMTKDGHKVEIWGNVDSPDQIPQIGLQKGSGVGLYRSEALFLGREEFPSEKEQFFLYKELLEKAPYTPVTIRIFDVGGDKIIKKKESGCRGVRFLLRNPPILQAQLRALLRAARFGTLRILLPMISDVSEIFLIKEKIVKTQKFLEEKGEKVGEYQIGSMIEVPAAAMMPHIIAKESDFLSIGSNDLIQYTLAVDRIDAKFSDIYTGFHPSVLQLFKAISSAAKLHKKPLVLCGEMGSNLKALPLLVGIGIEAFSVRVNDIALIKEKIREIDKKQAQDLANRALKKVTTKEVLASLELL